jgi:hypothetical protein
MRDNSPTCSSSFVDCVATNDEVPHEEALGWIWHEAVLEYVYVLPGAIKNIIERPQSL